MIHLKETLTYVFLTGDYKELKELQDDMKYQPPDYWRSPAYQLYKKSKGKKGWDGWINVLTGSKTAWKALRGHRQEILRTCDKLEIQVEQTLLPREFSEITYEDVPPDILDSGFDLDERQREGVAAWLREGCATLKVTVSGGKTAMFAAAAEMILERHPSTRFLYVTPSERLCQQVHKEMKRFLPHRSVSQYGGGKNDLSGENIVVATGAILWRNFEKLRLSGEFETFTGFLADECHYLGSKSWSEVAKACAARYRFGASDTTKEDDIVRSTTIRGLTGPVLYQIAAEELIETGRIAKPHLYVVDIPAWQDTHEGFKHAPEPDTEAWFHDGDNWKKGTYMGPALELMEGGQMVPKTGYHLLNLDGKPTECPSRWVLLHRTYDKAIILNKERNRTVCDWAEFYSKKGWPTLVVCTRTTHVHILEAMLAKRVGEENVRSLFSEHTPRQRDQTFEWLKASEGGILVTPLVKVGVSINEIRGCVIADHVADWELANQIIGRAIRKKETDNRAFITFFIDRQHPGLRANTRALIKDLKKIRGYTFYHPCAGPEESFDNDSLKTSEASFL